EASSPGNPAEIPLHFISIGEDWAACLAGLDPTIGRELHQPDSKVLVDLKPGLPDVKRLLSRSSDRSSEIGWRMLPGQVFLKFFDLREETSGDLAFVVKNYARRFFQLLGWRVGSLCFAIELFK